MVETWLDPDLDVATRLRTQAGHCDRLGSPFYAGLLERAAGDAEAGGPVAEVLRGHESDPPNSMLALRLLGRCAGGFWKAPCPRWSGRPSAGP